MRTVIVLAGEIADDAVCRSILEQADDILCADGGAQHLRRLGIRPDFFIGDLDSIRPEDLAWLQAAGVPLERHQPRKNETDAELAVLAAIRRKKPLDGPQAIDLLGVFGNRPDHVLATQLLAARLARVDRPFRLTDGRSFVWTLTGGQTLQLKPPAADGIVSVAAISDSVDGLTYEGLSYPLQAASLVRGSSLGISNALAAGHTQARLTLAQGLALVFWVPADG